MKSDYSKVFDSLCKSKSIRAHFNALNKIHKSTMDNQLKKLLDKVLSILIDPRSLKDSTPVPLSESTLPCFTELLDYCKTQKERVKK